MSEVALPRPAVQENTVLSRVLPLASMIAGLLVLWLVGAVFLNGPQVKDAWERDEKKDWTLTELVGAAWSMERPILPAPQQVVADIQKSLSASITSPRNLLFHSWVTGSSTFVGFGLGVLLGVLLAVGIVHIRTLDRSLMPWVIASQTVPILAIAPMIVVVLGNMGLTGLLPKAVISMYLCFFPVTIGLVKGLRSPDPLQIDLMRTYSASRSQMFWKLRWPASLPFLFTSLKVAISIALVGAIVGELPTGAQAGLGARLLAGSYYGQTVQIWSALIMAAVMGMLLVGLIGLIERFVVKSHGGRA
ncbi:ABC transporter permease [Lacibacterium aquatile]|uniref:ABC transporter permease n=1 Tax=Lacibacterium aquatile TaxID=1168082 RepID=A0ABW5DMK5_9PROT